MRILDLLAHWHNDVLRLVGMIRDTENRFHSAIQSDLEERQFQGLIRAAGDDQLQAWQSAGARVAQTINTPGWEDMFREHNEEDKRLLEFFVDDACNSWDKHQRQVGAVLQHRQRLRVMAYGQVRLGIKAEEELIERARKRKKKEPNKTGGDEVNDAR